MFKLLKDPQDHEVLHQISTFARQYRLVVKQHSKVHSEHFSVMLEWAIRMQKVHLPVSSVSYFRLWLEIIVLAHL